MMTNVRSKTLIPRKKPADWASREYNTIYEFLVPYYKWIEYAVDTENPT